MLKKRRFLAVNSSVSGGADQSCNQKPALSPLATSLVYKNVLSLLNIASHCEQKYKTSKKMTKYEEKVLVFLTKADVFTQSNVPKPLKNLYSI